MYVCEFKDSIAIESRLALTSLFFIFYQVLPLQACATTPSKEVLLKVLGVKSESRAFPDVYSELLFAIGCDVCDTL